MTVQGASSLTLGTATTNTGGILLKNATNSNTLTLQSGATGSNLTLTLPNADGSNGNCLETNGSGVLSFQACTGGAGGGVTSLDGLTGVLTINNSTGSGSAITIDNATTGAKGIASFNATNFTVTSGAVNTKQDIATTSSPTFAATTLTGSGPSLVVSGAPTGGAPGATSSLVQLGSALTNGNNATNGGTYLGLNAPSVGAGSAADFLRFQYNGANKLLVTNAGLLDAAGGLAVSGTTVIDSSLAIQSGVTASTNLLTSGTLGIARGGTGIASYTIGDLLYASGATTLSKLADVATGQVLISGGAGVAPSWSGSPTLSGALTIQGSSALTLGTTGTNTGAILFKGSTAASGTVTLQGPANPSTNNYTLSIPAIVGNANLCTDTSNGNSVCTGYAPSSGGNYIAKNTNDTSSASFLGNLLGLTNTNTGAAGVLSLANNGTNSALSILQSGTSEPSSGQALILANNNTTTPTGNLIDLQNKGTSKFSVDVNGVVLAASTISGSTLNGTTGINTGAGAGTLRIDVNGNLLNIGTISSGLINGQTISSAANFTGTLTIPTANGLVLGTASSSIGGIQFKGSGGAGTLTLKGPTTPNAGNFTLSIPAITGNANVCTTDTSISSGCLARNLQDSSSASVAGNLLALTNTNTGAFSGVLSLTGNGTNNALSVVQSGTSEPAFGKALIVANNNTPTPTGNLLDLQNKGTSKFSVDVNGAVTAASTLQATSAILSGTLTVQGAVSLGQVGVSNGNIYFQGGDFGGVYIVGPATTNNTAFNLALPVLGANATFCTSDNAYLCPSYIQNQSASAQSANLNIVSTSLTTTTATIKALKVGLTTQTANLLEFQGNNGTPNGAIGPSGNELFLGGGFIDGQLSLRNAGGSASYGHLKVDALTTDRTYLLPDETVGSNTICLQSSSSCGFLTSTTGIPDSTSIATENIYMTNGGTTSDVTLRIQKSAAQTGNLLEFCSTSGCASPIASVNTSGGFSVFSLAVANSITGNTINGATISTNNFAGATITSSTFNNQTLSANLLTFSGTPVISPSVTANDITLQSGGTGAVNIGTTGTGALTMGSTNQTGIVTLDQSTKSHTLNIGTGVTENAATLTIHIGDGGAAGSTTNITIGSAIAGTLTVKSAATFNKAITVGGHIIGTNTSGSTTVAANTAVCGTGCTVTITGSNDTSGLITVNTGTGVTAGTLATVTFASDYGVAPRIVLTPETVPASSNFPQYYYGVGTHTFDLKSYNALSDSKTYTFSYHIIQ